MLHLAGLDQFPHRSGHVLHRHVGVDPVLVKEVDPVGAQALQRGLGDRPDVFGAAVDALRRVAAEEPELGGDHDFIAERGDGLAEQLLVGALAIGFGRVEKGDATLERAANQREAGLLVGRGAVAVAQAHAAETECGYLEAALSKNALFHGSSLSAAGAACG